MAKCLVHNAKHETQVDAASPPGTWIRLDLPNIYRKTHEAGEVSNFGRQVHELGVMYYLPTQISNMGVKFNTFSLEINQDRLCTITNLI